VICKIALSSIVNSGLLKEEPKIEKNTIQNNTPETTRANKLAKNIFQNDVFFSFCMKIQLMLQKCKETTQGKTLLHEWKVVLINGI
jgi:hypothetical protein